MFKHPGDYPEGAIRTELGAVDVEVILGPSKGVSKSLLGKLGKYTFYRCPLFWLVEGPVPIAVANEIHSAPLGGQDVRPYGITGKPPVQLARDVGNGVWGISDYLIDSADGLKYFVDILRKHNLHK